MWNYRNHWKSYYGSTSPVNYNLKLKKKGNSQHVSAQSHNKMAESLSIIQWELEAATPKQRFQNISTEQNAT